MSVFHLRVTVPRDLVIDAIDVNEDTVSHTIGGQSLHGTGIDAGQNVAQGGRQVARPRPASGYLG
jgi:hypothetical protein